MAGTAPGRGKPHEETLLLRAKGFLCLQLVLDEVEGAILRSLWGESCPATEARLALPCGPVLSGQTGQKPV